MDVLDSVLSLLHYETLPRPEQQTVESAKLVVRDRNDAEILASMIESKPKYAVTGDKDLLTPEVRAVFPTSRCKDFLREFLD